MARKRKASEKTAEETAKGIVANSGNCPEGQTQVATANGIDCVDHKAAAKPRNLIGVEQGLDEVPEEDSISEGRCYELFQQDVHIAIDGCRNIYSNWDELPQEMQHILVNMCFQLGQGGLSKFKNMNDGVEKEMWGMVSLDMMDSRWAQQTPERARRLRDRVLEVSSGE